MQKFVTTLTTETAKDTCQHVSFLAYHRSLNKLGKMLFNLRVDKVYKLGNVLFSLRFDEVYKLTRCLLELIYFVFLLFCLCPVCLICPISYPDYSLFFIIKKASEARRTLYFGGWVCL